MAYDFAYSCQYLNGVVLWIDAEQSFTNSWAEINGLDLNRVIIYRETAIEKYPIGWHLCHYIGEVN